MSRKRREKSMKETATRPVEVALDAIDAMLLRARKLRQKGDARRALVTLRHAVNVDENRARSWALLGAMLAGDGARRRRGAGVRAGALAECAGDPSPPRRRVERLAARLMLRRRLRSRSEPARDLRSRSERAPRDSQGSRSRTSPQDLRSRSGLASASSRSKASRRRGAEDRRGCRETGCSGGRRPRTQRSARRSTFSRGTPTFWRFVRQPQTRTEGAQDIRAPAAPQARRQGLARRAQGVRRRVAR